jgi:hypothetical protein
LGNKLSAPQFYFGAHLHSLDVCSAPNALTVDVERFAKSFLDQDFPCTIAIITDR